MARLSLNAADIVASIRDASLKFSADGLSLRNGAFQIYRVDDDDQEIPIFYADGEGNLTLKGNVYADNGVFRGDIFANNGTFNGEITATSGNIGGFNIVSNYFEPIDDDSEADSIVYIKLDENSDTFYQVFDNNGEYYIQKETDGTIKNEPLSDYAVRQKYKNSGARLISPSGQITLDGTNGKILAEDIELGGGAKIVDKITFSSNGETITSALYNPEKHDGKILQAANVNLTNEGRLWLGSMEFYGGTGNKDGYLRSVGVDVNGEINDGHWRINENGSAYFDQIRANNVTIKNSVLENQTVQSVGSLMVFKDTWNIVGYDSSNANSVELDGVNNLKPLDWVWNGTNFYQVSEEPGNKIKTYYVLDVSQVLSEELWSEEALAEKNQSEETSSEITQTEASRSEQTLTSEIYSYAPWAEEIFDSSVEYYEKDANGNFFKTEDDRPHSFINFVTAPPSSEGQIITKFGQSGKAVYARATEKSFIPGRQYYKKQWMSAEKASYEIATDSGFRQDEIYYEKIETYTETADTGFATGKNYYEKTETYAESLENDDEPLYALTYEKTGDESYNESKIYYEIKENAEYTPTNDDSPVASKTYYKEKIESGYVVTTDTSFRTNTTYYELLERAETEEVSETEETTELEEINCYVEVNTNEEFDENKTYYVYRVTVDFVVFADTAFQADITYYESKPTSEYVVTTDTGFVENKDYYEEKYVEASEIDENETYYKLVESYIVTKDESPVTGKVYYTKEEKYEVAAKYASGKIYYILPSYYTPTEDAELSAEKTYYYITTEPSGDYVTSILGETRGLDSYLGDFSVENSLTIASFYFDENNKPTYTKHLVLGQLESAGIDSLEGLSGFGLYANNVYLNGSLTTKDLNGKYAGINTKSEIKFTQGVEAIIEDNSPIVFWGGAESLETVSQAPFQVSQNGTLYAANAIIEGSIFTQGTLYAAKIYTADIYGNGSGLSIYDDSKGIIFKNKGLLGADSTSIFSIKNSGFYYGSQSLPFITPATVTRFRGRFQTQPTGEQTIYTLLQHRGLYFMDKNAAIKYRFIQQIDTANDNKPYICLQDENYKNIIKFKTEEVAIQTSLAASQDFYMGKDSDSNYTLHYEYKAGKGYDLYVNLS